MNEHLLRPAPALILTALHKEIDVTMIPPVRLAPLHENQNGSLARHHHGGNTVGVVAIRLATENVLPQNLVFRLGGRKEGSGQKQGDHPACMSRSHLDQLTNPGTRCNQPPRPLLLLPARQHVGNLRSLPGRKPLSQARHHLFVFGLGICRQVVPIVGIVLVVIQLLTPIGITNVTPARRA